MKIGRVGGHVGERIVDLKIEPHVIVVEVLHGDFGLLAEGHVPIAVQPTAWVETYGQRVDRAILAPTAGEEIAHRHFDRRLLFVVPVEPQDVVPGLGQRGRRHPDLLDRARAVDLRQREGRFLRDHDRGRDLPALSQFAGGVLSGAFRGHCPPALLAGEVLRADRARLRVGQPREVAQVRAQTVEFGRRRTLRHCAEGNRQTDNQSEQTISLVHDSLSR